MSEIKVRFYNIDSKTYLKNLSPIEWTANLGIIIFVFLAYALLI